MGGKGSNNLKSNRPESGGANKDERQEKSGLLDREKNEFAASQKAKEESAPHDPVSSAGDGQSGDKGELH